MYPEEVNFSTTQMALSNKNYVGLHDEDLTFCEYLRTNAWAQKEYAALKGTQAFRYPDDIKAYLAGKTEFIKAAIADMEGH